MGRDAVAARYLRRSGTFACPSDTLVIAGLGEKSWVLLSPTSPGSDGSFDISRDIGMYVGCVVKEPLKTDAVHHGGE
jgi:hypothetical protein